MLTKILNDHNWFFAGYCGKCRAKMEKWKNPKKAGELIKIAPSAGFFYHYHGSAVIKSDYTKKLNSYLDGLDNKEQSNSAM